MGAPLNQQGKRSHRQPSYRDPIHDRKAYGSASSMPGLPCPQFGRIRSTRHRVGVAATRSGSLIPVLGARREAHVDQVATAGPPRRAPQSQAGLPGWWRCPRFLRASLAWMALAHGAVRL
ncbi:hypothetical protein HEB94_003183 [Actinopolymorpha pittospori]|uniref:Uncharacterized protein n=1 Tax=Actinopolymorpha pittospori TaxID=648752 RepID=A0A927MSY5_9ACTN|nr:hypothetical protein [Actinopolymorpha pittospori]